MFLMWPWLVMLGMLVFLIGTVVGSFLNVCIYRIPWEKSVFWPGSRCPHCREAIAARDNLPVLGWVILRGECRTCGAPISIRYPMVEFLVGLLFLGVYLVDVIGSIRGAWGVIQLGTLGTLTYHAILIALLVAASFIDYDLYIIPDSITGTGVLLGLLIGTLVPWIRPVPASAITHWGGFGVGIFGLLVGAGLTASVRWAASAVATLLVSLREGQRVEVEAMGFGDVTLMAMIGSFLGWQAAVLTFFIGPFFGFIPACWKIVVKVKKLILRQKLSSTDRELPFGPYLGMAATFLVLSWPWLWPGWASGLFSTFRWFFWYMLGVNVAPDPGP